MGNQLAGIAPSQIFPVEHYLTDLSDFQFVSSLGSTRFFKVVKANSKEGLIVVKIFAIHDPSLPLQIYRNHLDVCRSKLIQTSNCLPFLKFIQTDKAGILIRQYMKDNLYDRISTRPFLNVLEKKWITFQILYALNQCHSVGICHGDVKLENIMITGWNWIMLTDFASFKPTYLPEDNPADFSYFFDTSRRRTCYIAPERFVRSFSSDSSDIASGNIVLPSEEFHKGDLNPKMDIFSAGCAFSELFTEGHAPFDFSQLLSYRSGEYSPLKITDKIEDAYIKELVLHMMQKDPNLRFSAAKYLEMMRGKSFPEYFNSFLFPYMQKFIGSSTTSPEEKIDNIQMDLNTILQRLRVNQSNSITKSDCSSEREIIDGVIFIISLVTSSLRAVKHCSGKLKAINILKFLAPYLNDELILDRLIPHLLYCTNDSFPQVKMLSLEVLTGCLALVETVPRSDANIFPEYLLPYLITLASDEVVMVRVTVARNIASLAETALRFLELSQLENSNLDTNEEVHIHYQTSYDSELQTLQESIQRCVTILLTNSDNIVKRTLLEFGINRLCVFFGRQKANDVLLSHMITVLNDKDDQHLRGAFFDSIVGVASYIGWQSSIILKPLLQQGLSDPEEFVTSKTLDTISCLAELGLFHQHILYDFIKEIAPFCCHPNLWIKSSCVGFICTVAKTLNIADIHCKLLPVLEPFLEHPVIQIEKEVILLGALKDPIPRSIFETVIRSSLIVPLMDFLQKRKKLRLIADQIDLRSMNTDINNAQLKTIYRRLVFDGLTDAIENKLLFMREYLLKLHASRTRHHSSDVESDGIINLRRDEMRQTAPFIQVNSVADAYMVPPISNYYRKQNEESPNRIGMSEEWQHMFGSSETRSPSPMIIKDPNQQSLTTPSSELPEELKEIQLSEQLPVQQQLISRESEHKINYNYSQTFESHSKVTKPSILMNKAEGILFQQYRTVCKNNFDRLLQHKSDQQISRIHAKKPCQGIQSETKQPPYSWKPKGILVAHLQEHRAAVNRIAVVPGTPYFASCSSDGTVKLWDCDRMERRSIVNRSRQTYSKSTDPIFSLAVCPKMQSIACGYDNGNILVFRIETASTKMATTDSRSLDPQEEGYAVDMSYFDSGSRSVLIYATMYGSIVGWDLRSPGTAWKLENDPKYGLLTTFVADEQQSWLTVGTSCGVHVCWDLRFNLPISSVIHPTGACVRRLLRHPYHRSCVLSAVQGHNEVSLWDLETEARQLTLWASSAPPFSSEPQEPHQTVHGLHVIPRDGNPAIITAGTDARIRYWDLANYEKNCIISPAANDQIDHLSVKYESKLIDGTAVIRELSPNPTQIVDEPRRGPETSPTGHLDSINDISLYHTTQWLLVSASNDGVIKVWK